MENIYYQPGPHRAERVQTLFSQIARRYDLINDVQSMGLHRLWKRRCIRIARARPGDRVLDLCCGTGDLAIRFRRDEPNIDVIGVDFNASMLRQAKQKTRAIGVPLARADALNLPFPDSVFDVVTVGFGLRNLASVDRGLLEILRVTRPGGRIVVLDFGRPENRAWRRCYLAYLSVAVPLFGKVFCGNARAYAYILASLRDFPAQTGIDRILKRIGAGETGVVQFAGGAMAINHATKPAA